MATINNLLFVLDEHTAANIAGLFRAFNVSSRVQIVPALIEQVISVNALAHLIGIRVSAVSHHLRSLRPMELVVARQDGKEVNYQVVDEHLISLFQQGVMHVQHG